MRLIYRACAALYRRQGRTQAFSPGPRAFVEGYRPPHSSTGTVHAGRGAVRQNLRARLRCLRRPKGRRRVPSESLAFVVDFRPPHPSTGTAHAGIMVVRQDLRARLHGDAPWWRVV